MQGHGIFAPEKYNSQGSEDSKFADGHSESKNLWRLFEWLIARASSKVYKMHNDWNPGQNYK